MAGVTIGGLLGKRLIYKQLQDGHRSGFEPVLLAACIPAKPGELVLEAGTGAGAALLCLGTRVQGLSGIGVERARPLVELASENFNINGLHGLSAIQADAAALPFAAQSFDHVLSNPPWFDVANTASPDTKRDLAHRATPELLGQWLQELTRVIRPGGTVSLILPAAGFAAAACLLHTQKCGGLTLFPLWPRVGTAAKMVIITAVKASRAPDRIAPGLVLHDDQGITPAAQAVLRDGGGLY